MSNSIEFNLGVYLAEHIIARNIPSLSNNQCTRNIIQVTSGEADEYQRLEDAWYSKRTSEEIRLRKERKEEKLTNVESYSVTQEAHKLSEDEWNAQMKYRYMLKEKYLPHTLKCRVPYIDFSNEEVNKKIKKGFIASMWDWDFCEWSLKEEDIVFENETDKYGEDDEYSMHNTYVTLKLELEPPSSYTGKDWIEIKTKQKKIWQ